MPHLRPHGGSGTAPTLTRADDDECNDDECNDDECNDDECRRSRVKRRAAHLVALVVVARPRDDVERGVGLDALAAHAAPANVLSPGARCGSRAGRTVLEFAPQAYL